jgi:hypothetical protein
MEFAEALKKIDGAQSVGGQMIVVKDGKHVLVGKQVQGMLIVENNDEAKAIVFEATGVAVADADTETPPGGAQLPAEPPPEGVQVQPVHQERHHEVHVDEKVDAKDKLKK